MYTYNLFTTSDPPNIRIPILQIFVFVIEGGQENFFYWSKIFFGPIKKQFQNFTAGLFLTPTGCFNSICLKTNTYQAIKNALLSHKNGICTFMRCGILTNDPWILMKITSLASTASVLNDAEFHLKFHHSVQKYFFFKTLK